MRTLQREFFLEKTFFNVYHRGKVRLQLERKAFRDTYFANELEAPKPKGGDGKNMQPNMGQRKESSPSLWQKNT